MLFRYAPNLGGEFMSTMYEIIDSLCKERGTNVTAMCKELDIARSSLSELSRGRSKTLSADKIVKISKYFNVDPDFLLGKTDKKEKAPADGESRFQEGDLIRLDADSMEILRAVRERPDMKILFSVTKNVTPDDLIKAIKIVEAFKNDKGKS
jgi:bacteriophage CI repressor helix-turn-helix domain